MQLFVIVIDNGKMFENLILNNLPFGILINPFILLEFVFFSR